jgi:hypothetical protein
MKCLSRREFFERSGKIVGGLAGGGILGSLPIVNSGCKGNSPRDLVKVNATFFNHLLGPLNSEKVYSGLSGESFTIKISDLGFDHVDGKRIIVRKSSGSIEQLGDLVKSSKNREISLTYPTNDESWDVYLMNAGGDYDLVDRGSVLFRDFTWHREDIDATGPEEPILEAFRQVNEVVDQPWRKYGSFVQKDDGIVRVGYNTRLVVKPTMFFRDIDPYVFVDPDCCPRDEDKLKYFLQSIFSCNTNTNLLGGQETSRTICNQQTGDLNIVGQNFLAFVYLKS